MEEGLRWKADGISLIPKSPRYQPEGVFIAVPEVYGRGQFDLYLEALGAEARNILGNARPQWVHLHGNGIYELPLDRIRAVVQAACPGAGMLGIEIDPALLEPGAVAGYRTVGVERFCLRMTAPCAGTYETIRKARALGAFVSAKICYSNTLSGRLFLQTVERALSASPNQICLSDIRSRGAFGAELLEKAGEFCSASGYRRVSIWTWAKGEASFDTLGLILSGRCAGLGPGAINYRSAVYANPELRPWMQTRLAGDFEAARAGGRLEQWLALAAGLYRLELRRDNLDNWLYRHAFALERIGIVGSNGKPAAGWPMEFCHRAARAARQALAGNEEYSVSAALLREKAAAAGREK
jgi:hypothetical protein